MRWANFLHIYQPYDQAQDILDQVVNQSYRRIFRGMRSIAAARLTLNINGALSELLQKRGYQDVIRDITTLAGEGKIEFTESAKFHTFLPYLPEAEIARQVRLNHETNKKIFGEVYRPTAFFPPEMAYSPLVGKVVAELGYKEIILDEIAFDGMVGHTPYDQTFKLQDTPSLQVVFRDRRLSNLIISAAARDAKTFEEAVGESAGYLLTAMDGETFGHHRPGLEELLFALMKSESIEQVFVSELPKLFPPKSMIAPKESTWAASEYDIAHHVQFHSWNDPDNQLHAIQWELYHFVLTEIVNAKESATFSIAREKLDSALASDQFFWASNRPWWSIEMIERGAFMLTDALQALGPGYKNATEKAREYYQNILSLAFSWQREGKIRKASHEMREAIRIPFHERTAERGKPEVYDAFIEMMKRQMEKSAAAKDYEQAILWRDAIWKLETKNDIYDAIHVTDLLRQYVLPGEIEKLMDEYKDSYRSIRGGQAEQR